MIINVTYCSESHTLIKNKEYIVFISTIRNDESDHEIHIDKNKWMSEWVIDVSAIVQLYHGENNFYFQWDDDEVHFV